ncbi:hypothetical protein F0P96_09845 [Hymenobacter busanensis]|uniref:Uncharacterized protein n=1 Tax=Hymenobacter busanensis TaxID=2607656 RepID=A0A7L4ZX27_9BACT|nr:hypothetical protein [Hymenobacter busanensis]KAA9333269.1 hypothetical protein F0P96_09845 [Hymenobacter busanensis]QHJ08054.1 hypothetical protein GUY19_12475 [Hymenobacter busanensis]
MPTLLRDQETLYFQNAAGSVFYHAAGYARLAWSAERVTPLETQTLYEHTLTLLRSAGAGKVLSEHAQRQPLPPSTQEWLSHDWVPRAVQQARFRYCAIIDGQNPLHRLSAQSIIADTSLGVLFKRFSSAEEAASWLLSLPA